MQQSSYVANVFQTYNVDKQVPDSAGTGTAYLTGVKTNYKTIGFDASIKYNDCQTMFENNKVYSIAKWAQDAGKRSGMYHFDCDVFFVNILVHFVF